jgi:flagellar basal-body rod protein FlgB
MIFPFGREPVGGGNKETGRKALFWSHGIAVASWEGINDRMIDALFNQPGYLGAKRLLDATVAKHDAIAANIANAETPNYKRVDLAPSFQTTLSHAIASGNTSQLQTISPQVAVDTKALAGNRDGNTVNMEQELVELSQNSLQHAVETQMVTAMLAKLKLAITGKSA